MSQKYQAKKKIMEYKAYRPDNNLKICANEIEAWRIFKIMAEFVSGFEFISKYEKEVTFFGYALTEAGFGFIILIFLAFIVQALKKNK